MALISFQVIDGVDKGKRFVDLETPVSIGREEGNSIRLNDDRVSRFHVKIMEDQSKIVLTDLDSTNGTRINGETVQLRLLRPGDRIEIGRSMMVFGTLEQIADMLRNDVGNTRFPDESNPHTQASDADIHYHLDEEEKPDVFDRDPPRLPNKLTPAQAAQLSEVLDFLHRALADSIESVQFQPKQKDARLSQHSWQQLQTVLTFLAGYSRQVAEPMTGSSSED